MRLVGGKDFYDNALAFGADQEIVFVRNRKDPINRDALPKDFPFAPYFWNVKSYFNLKRSAVDHLNLYKKGIGLSQNGRFYIKPVGFVSPLMVILASKIYQGIHLKYSIDNDVGEANFWAYNTFVDYINNKGFHFETGWGEEDGHRIKALKDAFFVREASKKELNWMIENRHTIIIGHGAAPFSSWRHTETWEFNTDRLKNIEFFKILDPYQTFQEISMWVGGVLPKDGNLMVEITDNKIKAAKHGFDKWSFRKMPEKKEKK